MEDDDEEGGEDDGEEDEGEDDEEVRTRYSPVAAAPSRRLSCATPCRTRHRARSLSVVHPAASGLLLSNPSLPSASRSGRRLSPRPSPASASGDRTLATKTKTTTRAAGAGAATRRGRTRTRRLGRFGRLVCPWLLSHSVR